MGKKEEAEKKKKKEIEKMRFYPYGCKVVLPGIKCAYRALYYSDIREHIRNHRSNIKNILLNKTAEKRTKARYYEVPAEWPNCESVIVHQNKQTKRQIKNPPNKKKSDNVAIFGPNGDCVYLDQELVLKTIEKQFVSHYVLFDSNSEKSGEKEENSSQATVNSGSSDIFIAPVECEYIPKASLENLSELTDSGKYIYS